jgi:signal transduction histidine kinase
VHPAAVGERAAQLPWLWPDAGSLEALARPLTHVDWPLLSTDPAVMLLAQRDRLYLPERAAVSLATLSRPPVVRTAIQWLEHDLGVWVDWRHPGILPIYSTALAIAHHATEIAKLTRQSDTGAAWTAGLLLPLGWLAVAAIDPGAVVACLTDPEFAADSSAAQRRHWGHDHTQIARCLCHAWRLPAWLTSCIAISDKAHIPRPAERADAALFATVQLAAVLAGRAGYSLQLGVDEAERAWLPLLGLGRRDLQSITKRFNQVDLSTAIARWRQDPRACPDLSGRLTAGVEGADVTSLIRPLEDELAHTQADLARFQADSEERLRHAKLNALAEFAAGASHEINNPLAVISGQSQYLLGRTPDEGHREALKSIVRQTQRINAILTDLMQFARPPQPVLQRVEWKEILQGALRSCRDLADAAGVTLQAARSSSPVWLEADPRLIQKALACLLRNGVEAATPNKGWVHVRARTDANWLTIVVEDNGPGPAGAQREHQFDPFYSGRSAGRGRGLGLPTAWRLAREHGGDVRFEPTSNGPTRFVLTLPLPEPAAQRLSA